MEHYNLPNKPGHYYVMLKSGKVEIAKVAPFKLSTGLHVMIYEGKIREWGIDCEWPSPKDVSESKIAYFIGPVPECKDPNEEMDTRPRNMEWRNQEMKNPLISKEMGFIFKCQAIAKLEAELEQLKAERDAMATEEACAPAKK